MRILCDSTGGQHAQGALLMLCSSQLSLSDSVETAP